MAVEDVGVIVQIMLVVLKEKTSWTPAQFTNISSLYQEIRFPRTSQMLQNSTALGNMQLKRSENSWFNRKIDELKLQYQVFRHGTLPVMWFATRYDYQEEVKKFLIMKLKKENTLNAKL